MPDPAEICNDYPTSDTLAEPMIREMVKQAMAGKGWNLNKLANESGVAYRAVHDWLAEKGTGTRGPSVENLEKIIHALGIKVTAPRSAAPRPRKPQ